MDSEASCQEMAGARDGCSDDGHNGRHNSSYVAVFDITVLEPDRSTSSFRVVATLMSDDCGLDIDAIRRRLSSRCWIRFAMMPSSFA